MNNYFIEFISVENKKCLVNVNQITFIEKYAEDRIKIYLNDYTLFINAKYEDVIELIRKVARYE